MSTPAATGTKIFGIQLGVDPKIIFGVLIAVAGLAFWYNSRSDTDTPSGGTTTVRNQAVPAAPPAPLVRQTTQRRTARAANNGVLRVVIVDATRGDVDPTLRLNLLKRVSEVGAAENVRNLFDVGAAPAALVAIAKQIKGPVIVPRPMPVGNLPIGGPPGVPAVNIPLKFYGFSKPAIKGQPSRGLFLDGDNVLVAAEGEVLKQRYLVVEVTANSARLEDTTVKQGQTLPVVPAAQQQ